MIGYLTALGDTLDALLEGRDPLGDRAIERAPGGRLAGRSIEPRPFDARRLGDDLKTLHPQYTKAPLNMVVLQSDYRWLNTGLRHWRGPRRMAKVGSRFFWARSRGKKLIAMGAALAAELLLGVRQAGVPLRLNTGLVDLLGLEGQRHDATLVRGFVR